MSNRRNALLHDVLLNNNPNPTAQTGWMKLSQREYDVLTWDYGQASWSLGCNRGRIGSGTVGWIYRSDGSHGHVAGLIVFGEKQFAETEPGGIVHYRNGWLWRLPREWWIDGARVSAHPDWSGRAPFGAVHRFRNGEELKGPDRAVLWQLLHGVVQEWVEHKLSQLRLAP